MTVPIFLITDFGDESYYVGALKGAIKGFCPDVEIHDITHKVLPFNVKHGAFLIWQSLTAIPEGSIIVGVVDPGVGSERDPIILKGKRTYVGPDNGLFWPSIIEEGDFKAYTIDLDATGLKERRTGTFDGRDVFAPVAGMIACGKAIDEIGVEKPVSELVKLNLWNYKRAEGSIKGEVLNVDRFGNIITNIPWEEVESTSTARIRVGRATVRASQSTYYGGRGFLIIKGSTNLLEISVARGNAAEVLGAMVGDEVEVIT